MTKLESLFHKLV